MNSARFALEHKHTIFALLLAVLFLGVFSRFTIKTELFPDTSPPLVNVITPYPGAGAATVAGDVSEVLEEEFATLSGVSRITSSSQDGLSLVTVEFHYGTDQDLAAVDVQNTIDRSRNKLPAAIGDPQVLKFSTASKPIITVGVSSAQVPLTQIRALAEDELVQKLQLLEGVAAVDIFGGYRRSINILLDKNRLAAHKVSPHEVMTALQQQNTDAPGGKIISGPQEIAITVSARYTDVAAVENTLIRATGKRPLYIRDIARVEEGTTQDSSRFHAGESPAIALQVIKQDGANSVVVAREVKKLLADLAEQYPQLDFAVTDDDSVFTQLVVGNMSSSVVMSLAFTALLVLLFIVKAADSIVIAFSMPFSLLATFACMRFFGLNLNMITISALILSIGFIVDNSIVVLENIARHKNDLGKPMGEAAVDGTGEVMLSILAGTSTTVVVLFPFLFLEGFVGRVFQPLAATMAIALSASYLIAVLVVPLLAVLLDGKDFPALERAFSLLARPFQKFITWLKQLYTGLLKTVLTRRALFLVLVVAFLATGGRLLISRGMEVLPKIDNGTFTISLETTPGSSLEKTAQIAGMVEDILQAEPEVTNFSTRIGYETGARYLGESGAMAINQAQLTVNLTTRQERREDIWMIMDRIRGKIAALPGIQTFVVKEVGGTALPTTRAPIDIQVQGPDPDLVNHLTDAVLERVEQVPGVVNLHKGWEPLTPEIELTVNRHRAGELGLTPAAIGQQLFAAVEGLAATTLETEGGGSTTGIHLRYAPQQRDSLADLLDTRLTSPLGVQVPLRAVATAREVPKPPLLTREDFSLTNNVYGFTLGRPLSHVVDDIEKELAHLQIPAGYQIALQGEQQDLLDSRADMLAVLAVGIAAVYLLLLAQLCSFTYPLVIMTSIPVVLIGVAPALFLTGKTVSMPVLLGFILLAGTVVNNAILLVEHITAGRERGKPRAAAIIEAVQVRFRPIMMTAFSDVAGMLPLALELSLGSERFSPLAITVIGGILAATLLTLILIPVVYTLLDDLAPGAKEKTAPPAGM